jgi:hypothetical protein
MHRNDQESDRASQPGSIAYFGTWAGYRVPFVPRDPITREQALQRQTYYVAHYNQAGQLVRFEKHLDGALEWVDEYEYWDDGTIQARLMTKADGTQTAQQFDRKGRIILNKPEP